MLFLRPVFGGEHNTNIDFVRGDGRVWFGAHFGSCNVVQLQLPPSIAWCNVYKPSSLRHVDWRNWGSKLHWIAERTGLKPLRWCNFDSASKERFGTSAVSSRYRYCFLSVVARLLTVGARNQQRQRPFDCTVTATRSSWQQRERGSESAHLLTECPFPRVPLEATLTFESDVTTTEDVAKLSERDRSLPRCQVP